MAPIDINNQEINSITLNGSTEIDTVTVNGQVVFSPSIKIDFESGSLSSLNLPQNWTFVFEGPSGDTRIQSGTVLDGNHSLECDSSNNRDRGIKIIPDSPIQPNEIRYLVRANSRNGQNGQGNRFFLERNGNYLISQDLEDDGSVEAQLVGRSLSNGWSTNVTYQWRIYNIDYSNNLYDIDFRNYDNDTLVETETNIPFKTNASSIDAIRLIKNGGNSPGYYDLLEIE